MNIIILAAGIGSRLGNPFPKPLTQLKDGETIMQHQLKNLSGKYDLNRVMIVVGFKKDLIMEAHPIAGFVYNPDFDSTNTSKSLLVGLKKTDTDGVLWLNGDVVFDAAVLTTIEAYIKKDISFVCVNTEEVGEEEVKYTVNENGYINELSKTVKNGIGEAVGINYISSKDKSIFIKQLEAVDANDYFERGLELAILNDGLKVLPVDISSHQCIEVDFKEDLERANQSLS